MNTKKIFGQKNVEFFVALVFIIVSATALGLCEFKMAGEIGFLMTSGALSFLMSIIFIFLLITTWERDLMRVILIIFFLSIFLASISSKLSFSLTGAIVISISMTILPTLITLLFHKKERKEKLEEKLKEKGYRFQGCLADGVRIFSNENLDIAVVSKNHEIIKTIGLDWSD